MVPETLKPAHTLNWKTIQVLYLVYLFVIIHFLDNDMHHKYFPINDNLGTGISYNENIRKENF